MSKTDLKEFGYAMKGVMDKLQKQLHTIDYADVLEIMGYNVNWTNILKLK